MTKPNKRAKSVEAWAVYSLVHEEIYWCAYTCEMKIFFYRQYRAIEYLESLGLDDWMGLFKIIKVRITEIPTAKVGKGLNNKV